MDSLFYRFEGSSGSGVRGSGSRFRGSRARFSVLASDREPGTENQTLEPTNLEPPNLSSTLNRRSRFPVRFSPPDRLALVEFLLALGEADRHFHAPLLEVHAHRYERHAL